MYCRYKGPPPDGWYSVCSVAAILDNRFTELIFCGLRVGLEKGVLVCCNPLSD